MFTFLLLSSHCKWRRSLAIFNWNIFHTYNFIKETGCIVWQDLLKTYSEKVIKQFYYETILWMVHNEMNYAQVNPLLHRHMFFTSAAAHNILKHCDKGRNCFSRSNFFLCHNVFKAFQLQKCPFLSAKWTFIIFLNVVCCKIVVWGKGLKYKKQKQQHKKLNICKDEYPAGFPLFQFTL